MGQWRDVIAQGEPVEQIIPEPDPEFLTGLLEAGESIACTTAVLGAGGAGDFAFDDVLADVALAQIIVQRDVRTFEHEQQLGFVLVPSFEGLVERLEIGFGFTQRVEAVVDGPFGLGGGLELVGLELVVEGPQGLPGALQRLNVEVIEGQD